MMIPHFSQASRIIHMYWTRPSLLLLLPLLPTSSSHSIRPSLFLLSLSSLTHHLLIVASCCLPLLLLLYASATSRPTIVLLQVLDAQMMPNAISSMNPPRKRDHDDELHTLNRNLKSARLDSSDHLSMLVSQGNVMQPMLAPNPMNTYAPSSSSFPLYQTMTTVEGPPFSMHAHLLHHDMQNPLMPAGLLTSMPQTLSHENLTHVFDGSELTLDTTDQSSSPYFNTTSPIDENSLVSPTMQRAPDGFPSPETFEFVLDEYVGLAWSL